MFESSKIEKANPDKYRSKTDTSHSGKKIFNLVAQRTQLMME
jgi:hypothetical protein